MYKIFLHDDRYDDKIDMNCKDPCIIKISFFPVLLIKLQIFIICIKIRNKINKIFFEILFNLINL